MVQLPIFGQSPIPDRSTLLAGAAVFLAGYLIRGFLAKSTRAGVTPSPRLTLLPTLSKEDQLSLPYPPDALPGARDVDTPFGSFRVYEWGPEDGKKVLLVHGISTPCLALGALAHSLVDKGCRVLLFDLPGRGYSDTPTDIQHDIRLFASQILIVLASSTLSWSAANGGFALIGYSLGGGISAAFTSYFPNLVNALVLIAPAGLIRDRHISRTSRILYSEGVIPEPILNRLVRHRLQKPLYPSKPEQVMSDNETDVTKVTKAEVNIEGNDSVILSKSHPDITIEAAVNHQIVNHEGFVQAFMSSIRYGPILHQHGRWRHVGRNITEKNKLLGLNVKVLIVLGERDPIIVVDEIKQDATEVLENNVEFKVFSAGHEVPITLSEDVANAIWSHWQKDV